MSYYKRHLVRLFLLVVLNHCKQPTFFTPTDNTSTRDDNIALGNPDGAKASESNPNAYLITRSTYSLSYNNSTGIANWRSWHLSAAELTVLFTLS